MALFEGRMRGFWLAAMTAVQVACWSPIAHAQSCTREDFAKIVNDSGAALRRLSAESQPKLQAGFRKLKDKNGWREEDYIERVNAMLADARIEALDQKSSDLLAKLDRLAEEASKSPDGCARLSELEATALELQATVRTKTDYQLARLDAAIGDAPAAKPQPQAQTKVPPKQPPQAKAPTKEPTPGKDKEQNAAKPIDKGWVSSSSQQPTAMQEPMQPLPGSGPYQLPDTQAPSEDGYTIDEIRTATRGFFGTVSTGLASVIEHAFTRMGKPSGYVLGNEGGGAFLAGVRYGKGTLYLRSGGTREVYWHGPSIGYDLGAEGSKTMFLIYRLQDPESLFSGFSGVDGSAYIVGGVGMTLLTDGKVVMAPIRSGLGLRLGANIGYIRFTARPTWNPF